MNLTLIHEFDTHSWIWHWQTLIPILAFLVSYKTRAGGLKSHEESRTLVRDAKIWLIHECDVTCLNVTRLMRHMTHAKSDFFYMWHVTWLVHTWHDVGELDMIHSLSRLLRMWHDSFTRGMTRLHVVWFIRWQISFTCDMTRTHVTSLVHTWHDSFTCDMMHSCVWYDWFM